MEVCHRYNIPPFPQHPLEWTPQQWAIFEEFVWQKYENNKRREIETMVASNKGRVASAAEYFGDG